MKQIKIPPHHWKLHKKFNKMFCCFVVNELGHDFKCKVVDIRDTDIGSWCQSIDTADIQKLMNCLYNWSGLVLTLLCVVLFAGNG